MCKRSFSFKVRPFWFVTPCLEFTSFLSAWKIIWKLNLTAHLFLVRPQRIRGGIHLLYSNQLRCLLYRSTEAVWPAPIPGCNYGRVSISSDSELHSKAT